ncbi:MAG: MBL fold metallo-hydrolase [Lachnospiraceae bacterium]|jgi:L-ascorbate metabolism protein UlaG (beta-lactamase superfamily)
MENREITVRQLNNAGVALCMEGITVYVDIFCHRVPDLYLYADYELEQDAYKGKPQYFLLTHEHRDHYHTEKVVQFSRKHRDMVIFANGRICWELREDVDNPLVEVKHEKMVEYKLSPQIELTAFCCTHMGEQYRDIDNICYYFKTRNGNVLITGDAEPYALLDQVEKNRWQVDYLISPFTYVTLSRVRERLSHIRKMIAVHFPNPKKDEDHWISCFELVLKKQQMVPEVFYGKKLGQTFRL